MSLCAQSVLAAVSMVMQPIADAQIDGRRFPVSEYFLTIGASGERKSAVDNLVLKPVRDFEAEKIREHKRLTKEYHDTLKVYDSGVKSILSSKLDQATKSLKLAQLGPSPEPPVAPIVIVSDPTVEGLAKLFATGQPALGLFTDEGGRLIGGHSMNDENRLKTAATLSKYWDGQPPDRVRSGDGASKDLGKRLAIHIQAQPAVAALFLGNGLVQDQGLTARFLIVYPESTAGSRKYCDVDLSKDSAIIDLWDLLRSALFRPLPLKPDTVNELAPRTIELEPEAKKAYCDFHDEVESLLAADGEFAPIRSFASKAAEHCLRLAALFSLSRNLEASQIYMDDLQSAIVLIRFYLKEALRLQGIAEQEPELQLAEKFWQWLSRKRSSGQRVISLVECYQLGPNAVRSKQKASELLALLSEHGLVRRINETVVFRGIPRTNVYEIREVEDEVC